MNYRDHSDASDPIPLPTRNAELIAAIRGQCPPDRLAELDDYLYKHPPLAGRASGGDWAGLCQRVPASFERHIIHVDPDCAAPLTIYLHEVAHAAVGLHRSHDHAFQLAAEALYQRFGCRRSAAGKAYDMKSAAPRLRTAGARGSRESLAYKMAQEPVKLEAVGEIGRQADRLDFEYARGAEWASVLLPLLYLGVPAVILSIWLAYGDRIAEAVETLPFRVEFIPLAAVFLFAVWCVKSE